MPSKSDLQKKYFGTTSPKEILDILLFRNPVEAAKNTPKDLKDWVDLEVPYYAPEDQLPCPLPTMASIEAARGTENDLTRDNPLMQQFVYKVGDTYAVKFALSPMILQEAENLLFLAKNTRMRVPKVYAAFEHHGADPLGLLRMPEKFPDRSSLPKYYYFVMEFVPGRICSEEVWGSLSLAAQKNIVLKVAEQMRFLRDAPTPSPAYYGRIHHRGWFPNFPQLQAAGPPGTLRGPYDSHQDFLDAIYMSAEIFCCQQTGADDFPPLTKLYLQTFPQIMSRASGTTPVLSHLDFNLGQVMLQEKSDNEENFDVVLLDWAWMGWVPAYMDTARSWAVYPLEFFDAIYNWEMGKDVEPAHFDTASFFREFSSSATALP